MCSRICDYYCFGGLSLTWVLLLRCPLTPLNDFLKKILGHVCVTYDYLVDKSRGYKTDL